MTGLIKRQMSIPGQPEAVEAMVLRIAP